MSRTASTVGRPSVEEQMARIQAEQAGTTGTTTPVVTVGGVSAEELKRKLEQSRLEAKRMELQLVVAEKPQLASLYDEYERINRRLQTHLRTQPSEESKRNSVQHAQNMLPKLRTQLTELQDKIAQYELYADPGKWDEAHKVAENQFRTHMETARTALIEAAQKEGVDVSALLS